MCIKFKIERQTKAIKKICFDENRKLIDKRKKKLKENRKI